MWLIIYLLVLILITGIATASAIVAYVKINDPEKRKFMDWVIWVSGAAFIAANITLGVTIFEHQKKIDASTNSRIILRDLPTIKRMTPEERSKELEKYRKKG